MRSRVDDVQRKSECVKREQQCYGLWAWHLMILGIKIIWFELFENKVEVLPFFSFRR